MSRLVLGDFKTLMDMVDVASNLLCDVTFIFSDAGLHLGQLDASKSAAIGLFLPKDEFEEFDGFFDGAELCIGMDALTGLQTALKSSSASGISFDVDWGQREVTIEVIGHGKSTFVPPLLIPPEGKRSSFKQENPSVIFSISSKRLTDAINKVKVGGTVVTITADEENLTLESLGEQPFRTVKDIIPVSDEEIFRSYELKDVTRTQYAKLYLTDVLTLIKKRNFTEVAFASNKPISFTTGLGDKGTMWMTIAPRVERR